MHTPESVLSWAELITDRLNPPKGSRLWVGDAESGHGGFTVWLDVPRWGQVGVVVDGCDESEAELLARIADQFQDYLLECTGGSPHPPCPGHQHPAVSDVINGTAVWRCPRDIEQALRPILASRCGEGGPFSAGSAEARTSPGISPLT